MRKVFSSHSELAHVWAQNSQPSGKASRMFFEGGRLYSYGRHFCIARILPSGVVVMGTHTYSSSTSKHQYKASSAVSHRQMVYCYDPDASPWTNKDHTERDIQRALEKAVSKGVRERTRLQARRDAFNEARRFNAYLEALPEGERGQCKPFDLAQYELSVDQHNRLRELNAEAEALREARWQDRSIRTRQQLEAWNAKAAERIEKWRNGENANVNGVTPTMLRLSKVRDEVETSRGAAIPVSHAKRLWPLIQNCKAVGKPLEREMRLGHYTLTRIEVNGDITVGCHNIPYAEIEGIAKALGLLEVEA